ncbi:MAG: hypothetical protein VYE15_03310, partial [Myxococcota bacterium]|nr:hypothetical protein [Myxococcota bacterium]
SAATPEPDPFDQSMPDYEEFSQDERPMGPGAEVFHPTFGQGRVMRLDGQGREARAQVRFDDGEVRRIVARFLTVV